MTKAKKPELVKVRRRAAASPRAAEFSVRLVRIEIKADENGNVTRHIECDGMPANGIAQCEVLGTMVAGIIRSFSRGGQR